MGITTGILTALLTVDTPMATIILTGIIMDHPTITVAIITATTWRVRNDGNKAWPEGVTLIPAGGDSLCPEETVLSLPGMDIDEEQEVHVTLQAPEKPGLYTQYFRARTREQQLFGHRLWVSVMVEGE
eukprot:gene14022-10020_t